MKNKYGFIGLISLLGFWGLESGNEIFLCFFSFIVFLYYFRIKPDELFVQTLRKCATNAFLANLFVTTLTTFLLDYLEISSNPLAGGASLGFGVSIIFFSLSTFILELKQSRGLSDD